MQISEKAKQCIREWDRENMHTISCRVRTEQAEWFKAYCDAHHTTMAREIKTYVEECIDEYFHDLEKAEEELGKKESEKST